MPDPKIGTGRSTFFTYIVRNKTTLRLRRNTPFLADSSLFKLPRALFATLLYCLCRSELSSPDRAAHRGKGSTVQGPAHSLINVNRGQWEWLLGVRLIFYQLYLEHYPSVFSAILYCCNESKSAESKGSNPFPTLPSTVLPPPLLALGADPGARIQKGPKCRPCGPFGSGARDRSLPLPPLGGGGVPRGPDGRVSNTVSGRPWEAIAIYQPT